MKEVGAAVQATTAFAELAADRREAFRTEIGRDGALEPGPHAFDGVELGGVGGESVHREPGALGVEVGVRLDAAVGVEAIPEQDHGTAQMATQVFEEADHLRRADVLRVGGE